MTQRLAAPYKHAAKPYQAMLALETALAESGLEKSLIELIKTRVSQINGCAFCIHMHVTDAVKAGESHMRLHMLSAWRESSLYTPRERAALAWAEALTLLPQTGAPDSDWDELQAHFSEAEQVNVTFAVGAINTWNRLAVGLRAQHPADTGRAAA